MFQIIKIKCMVYSWILKKWQLSLQEKKCRKSIYPDLCKFGEKKCFKKKITSSFSIKLFRYKEKLGKSFVNWNYYYFKSINIYIYVLNICNDTFQIIIPYFHLKFAHVSSVIGTQFLFAFVKSSFTRGTASLLLSLG